MWRSRKRAALRPPFHGSSVELGSPGLERGDDPAQGLGRQEGGRQGDGWRTQRGDRFVGNPDRFVVRAFSSSPDFDAIHLWQRHGSARRPAGSALGLPYVGLWRCFARVVGSLDEVLHS